MLPLKSVTKTSTAWIFLFLLTVPGGVFAGAQPAQRPCSHCVEWNTPQHPFRIYGSTYYVGPHGLSSILITSDQGHVLIDGALRESAQQIAANIRTLGFRVEDVKLIVNSHAHYDHGGGIGELQRLSGARVAASPWTAAVMKTGKAGRDDPQYGVLFPIPPIARVQKLQDGQTLHVGPLALTAHFTPGHTPGGTSWTWQSCENNRCLNVVYADSMNAVSAERLQVQRTPTPGDVCRF
jgi:metallo-beta-lactamase class B